MFKIKNTIVAILFNLFKIFLPFSFIILTDLLILISLFQIPLTYPVIVTYLYSYSKLLSLKL